MIIRPTSIALAIATAITAVSAQASDLIISEYVEGSSYNKALELYNNSGITIDLSGYQLVRYTNGDASRSSSTVLSGNLAAGATFVIANSRASAEIKAKAQLIEGSVTNFNGDDPIELQTSDGVLIDQVGVFGKVNFGKDRTLARKSNQLSASTIYAEDQWDRLAKNSIDGLGVAPTGDTAPPVVPVWSCSGDLTPIQQVQGDSSRSPLIERGFEGGLVTVQGFVTKRVEKLYKGFFLQAEVNDGNELTSEGIFIATDGVPDVAIVEGSRICLQGQVQEFFGQTQLTLSAANFEVLQGQAADIQPVQMNLDSSLPLQPQLEKYEGMLVSTTNAGLVVTRNFGFDFDSFRNNLVLSHGTPLYKPTQKFAALSDQAKALQAANAQNRLFVETDSKPANGVIPYFSGLNAENGYIRIGDRVQNLEGVIGYSFGEYRLIPETAENLQASDFEHQFSDRRDQPQLPIADDLRVASFNVLNYFNSGVGGDANPIGQNRGAGSNLEDFQKQQIKIVNAMLQMNADIIGLMEIENNGFSANSAIQNLLDALNAAQVNSADHYQFVASTSGQPIGTDAITVGLIYRAARVSPAVASEIIEMPIQRAEYQGLVNDEAVTKSLFKGQRNALLQRFEVTDSTSDAFGRQLTVVVNHFKSKGSQCFNDFVEYQQPIPLTSSGRIDERNAQRVAGFEEDLQGSCNELRLSAAKVLGDYLAQNAAGDILLMGDYNAYGKEDPIRLLTDYNGSNQSRQLVTAPYTFVGDQPLAGEQGEVLNRGYGYVNLAEHQHGTKAFSYSFDGELGSLDHVLGSQSIVSKLLAVTDWHINSLENNLFEYNRRFSGDLAKSDNLFSSSDHDPVILSLDYSQSLLVSVASAQGKVQLKTNGYQSSSFSRNGLASPDALNENQGQVAIISTDNESAIVVLGEQAEITLDNISSAWAIALQQVKTQSEILALDRQQLKRAKLDLSRDGVTRLAIALALAEQLVINPQTLIDQALAYPSKSHVQHLINLGRAEQRSELRAIVAEVESTTKPAVQLSRQALMK